MAFVTNLELHRPGGTTDHWVGVDALSAAAQELSGWLAGRRLFVITAEGVWRLHGEVLAPFCGSAAETVVLQVPDGEAAKQVAVAEELWRGMLAAGGKRDSRVLAFGGGTVGDLAGFVAGCFLRGIEVVQVPTTLLAQVDAAVGGKTAVDLPEGKNTVGLFLHPRGVVADTRLLSTLDRAELRSGLMEVVKMGMLLDADLVRAVEADLELLLEGDPVTLAPVVAAAQRAKIGVVEKDPTEKDLRRLLNFGHTLGHAIETALGYRLLRHGEAVAYGMLFALRLAARRGLPETDRERLRALLSRVGLPDLPELRSEELLEIMSRDKKATEGGLPWVLPTALGAGRVVDGIGRPELGRELEFFLRDPWSL